MIGVACLVAIGVVSGRAWVHVLVPGAPESLGLAWGWVLGQGLLSMSAGLCLLLGLPFELAFIPLLLSLLWALTRARRTATSGGRNNGSADGKSRTVAGVLGIVAIVASGAPADLGWDGLAIWSLKAKVLAESGELQLEHMRHPSALPSHPEYPLHVPLLGGLAGSWNGRITGSTDGTFDDRTLPLLAAVDFLAIALLLVSWIERSGAVRPGASAQIWWRILWLVCGLLVPLVWKELGEGKADITVALCVLAALIALVRWLEEDCRGSLLIAALASGTAAWSKQEGLAWLLILGVVAAFLAGERRRELMPAAFLAGLIALPWHLLRSPFGLETEPFSLNTNSIARLPAVMMAVLRDMASPAIWSLLWLGVALSFGILGWRLVRRAVSLSEADSLVTLSLGAGIAAVVGIFLATPHDLDWHLQTALTRLLLQWWPIAVLVVEAGARALLRDAEESILVRSQDGA